MPSPLPPPAFFPALQVLGRIREILEGRPHSGMEAGPATIDRCCGSDDDSGAAGCGGGVVEEDGTGGAARPAAVKGEAPFRILLAGHSLGACLRAAGAVARVTFFPWHGEVARRVLSRCRHMPHLVHYATCPPAHQLACLPCPAPAGGAMSHLCGIDLARALPGWGFQVAPAALPLSEAAAEAGPTVSLSTYTFGAPRTGNRAFAKDYAGEAAACSLQGRTSSCETPQASPSQSGACLDAHHLHPRPVAPCQLLTTSACVHALTHTHTQLLPALPPLACPPPFAAHMPDCWSIINGQDAVANQAKFLVLFKRPGKPVLLSRRGDLIVRPSTLEHTAHRTSGTSLKQHMLFGSYCPSLAAALRAQLTNKPMPGGQEALEHLRESEAMVQVRYSVVLHAWYCLTPHDTVWLQGAAEGGSSSMHGRAACAGACLHDWAAVAKAGAYPACPSILSHAPARAAAGAHAGPGGA